MKEIWRWITVQVRADFNAAHYGFVFIFLGISLTLNFYFNFENEYLALFPGWKKVLGFFALYAAAYVPVVCSYVLCYRQTKLFTSKAFWIKSILILSILSLDNGAVFLRAAVNHIDAAEIRTYLFLVGANLGGMITVFMPLLTYYFICEKTDTSTYGLRPKSIRLKPYFIVLLLMIPVIVISSFNENFLLQYPMYKSSGIHHYIGIPEWPAAFLFEMSYAFDFITVEFIFRGFLVIGMIAIFGRGSILIMAVVYCFLHFGKPPVEAISSIFGGYVLGVIAYETKSIWGGVLIHIGIAWAMELASYLQKL